VHLRDDPLFRVTITHKVFAYLASGKPVLAAMEGDVAALVESTGSGLTCPPGDPIALAATVRTFYTMSPETRAPIGEKGRNAVCHSYNRHKLVGEIGAMLEDALMRTGTALPSSERLTGSDIRTDR